MDQLLTDFLRTFSLAYPLPWALLVMASLGLAGLGLHLLWQLVLRGAGRVLGGAAGRGGKGDSGGGPERGGP